MTNKFISAENIFFSYGATSILKDISFSIEKGEVVAILGESGSGKSTLLRVLTGFEEPQKGSIKIDDKIIFGNRINTPIEKRPIGMVFQNYALFPHLNTQKNIAFGLKGKARDEKLKSVSKMMELVELAGLEKRYPHELSGGQQQRVAIARALAPKPQLLLLDEPFSNLDAHLRSVIRAGIKEILKKAQITSIFVTHDREDAVEVADKVIILKDGKIVQMGTTSEVTENPASDYVAELFK